MSNWKEIDNSHYKWVNGFNNIMSESDLPRFDGELIYIASDYSGYEKKNKHYVMSFLFLDWDNCYDWHLLRTFLRRNFFSDGRRMSYKKLNDKERFRMLVPFLDAASLIKGFCITFIIDKKIAGLVTHKQLLSMLRQENIIIGKWNIYEFENMSRITQFISLLLAGITKDNQEVIWISDNDYIFANDERKRDTSRIASSFVSHYVKQKLLKLSLGTTEIDEGDRLEEDLTAIPDLSAGTLSDIISNISLVDEYWLKEFQFPEEIKQKSNLIYSWINYKNKKLKNINLIFEKDKDGNVVLFPF